MMMNKAIENEIKSIKNIDELLDFKKNINEEIDGRKKVLELSKEAYELRNKKFGFIKESMENLSAELLKTKEGTKMLKRYINEIKSNKDLLSLYNFYENINEIEKDTNSIELIKELKEKIGKKEIKESDVLKLGTILSESYIWTNSNSQNLLPKNDRAEFYSITESIYSTIPDEKNLTKFYNDVNKLKKIVTEHKNKKTLGLFNDETKENVEENKEYSLTTSFDEAKNNCINKLENIKQKFNEEKDYESVKKIDLYIESVEKKKYNEKSVRDDITNLK